MLTKFHFYQPVCHLEYEHNSFPSEKELISLCLGPAHNTGDAFCSHILATNNTVIPRSVLRPAHDNPLHVTKRQSSGEVLLQNNTVEESATAVVPEDNDTPTEIDPQSLLNCEFIHHIGPNGYRAKATECYQDQDKHLISTGNGNKEETATHNHMLDVINKRLEEVDDKDAHETLWFLKNVVGHRLNHDKRKHSVKVRWSTKEETWEPLDIVAVDDPVACAEHAKENDLHELPGWKRSKRMAAREKKFTRMLRQCCAKPMHPRRRMLLSMCLV